MIKKSVFIFVLLSIFASALNYIIYPLFSRILTPSEYVKITVSLSLFTQVSAFLSSIIAITIGLSKSETASRATAKVELLQTFLFKLFLGLAIIFLIASPFIMSALHTPTLFALPIAIMMLLSLPILIVSGYLNGKNQMVKLGLVAVISASSQFVIGISVALLSHNGLATMIAMSLSQIIGITIIYRVLSGSKLPSPSESLKTPLSALRNASMKPLILYAALTALAIMAISIVQIVDLFIVQNLHGVNVKSYADIYVLSRVVFFVGMIFIWPFLGEMSVDQHHLNRRPFLKLMAYFIGITAGAIAGISLFGNQLTHLLFDASYSIDTLRSVGVLSILFKFFMLIVTAVVLYFIVLRSYVAVWFAVFASVAVYIFAELVDKNSGISTALLALDIVAASLALLGILLIFMLSIHRKRLSSL